MRIKPTPFFPRTLWAYLPTYIYIYTYIHKKHAIATDHGKRRGTSLDKFLFHRLLFLWHDMFQALELLKRMEFTDVISYSGSISACDAQLSLEMGFDQPAMGMCL